MKKTKEIEYLISLEDGKEISRLAKVAIATQQDCDSIYTLFKRYINPQAGMYRVDCNCYNSIGNYWTLLMEFYSENNGKTK
jgi:hypothetical protein